MLLMPVLEIYFSILFYSSIEKMKFGSTDSKHRSGGLQRRKSIGKMKFGSTDSKHRSGGLQRRTSIGKMKFGSRKVEVWRGEEA
jgi:hypothetical protein